MKWLGLGVERSKVQGHRGGGIESGTFCIFILIRLLELCQQESVVYTEADIGASGLFSAENK